MENFFLSPRPFPAQPITLPFSFSFPAGQKPPPPARFPFPSAQPVTPLFLSPLSPTRGTRPSSPSSGRAGTPPRVRAPLHAPSDSAWPARQGPAPYYKSNAPRPLEPKTQSRSRYFRQTLASAPSPLLELGAPSCVADSTAPRRLQALQEIRTEVVRLTGLFFPLFRPASPGNSRRCRTSALRRRELRSARDSPRRCLR